MAVVNVIQAELYAAIEETEIERWSKTSIQLYCESIDHDPSSLPSC
jgi:hypothetical protein